MLQLKDYDSAAAFLGCDTAAIRAVAKKEGGNTSFYAGAYSSPKIIIKFEGHLFHHYTNGIFDKQYPTLSYPAWTEQHTDKGPIGAYVRFNTAFNLDPKAAMMATSWVMFQILGNNYKSCGFTSVNEMVNELKKGDDENLQAFCQFVKRNELSKYLRGFKTNLVANSEGFALHYNGKYYARNNYATDIAKYYLQYITPIS